MTSVVPPPPVATASSQSRWPRWVRVGAVAVAVVAVATRAPWLGRPAVFVFDEVFYANDAVDLLQHGVEGGSPVHPPLGKWMIAAGIQLVGFSPVGWRIVVLGAGAAVAATTWLIGWRVTDRRRGAVVASSFVLLDGISVVTGRLALLDGLVALWTTLALLLLVEMADRPLESSFQRRQRRWLGVLLGLALATKWSAALLVPVALVTMVAIDQLLPAGRRLGRTLRSLAATAGLAVGVYVLAHGPWLINYDASPAADDSCAASTCAVGVVDRVIDIAGYHVEVWDYHRRLEPSQRDAEHAIFWVGQTRAVRLFEKTCEPGLADHADESDGLCRGSHSREIRVLSMGNPVLWVVGPIAVVAAAVFGWRRRHGAALVVAGAAVMFWLPWLVGGRASFTFYAAPLVPCLGACTAYVIEQLPDRVARWWPALVVAAALVSLALWPLWLGVPLEAAGADRLLWFSGWR